MLINPKNYIEKLLLSHGPIRPDELLKREQYEIFRPKLLAIGLEHKKQRRTRLNESLSLLLESRLTIWLQIHEELRWLAKPSKSQTAEILKTNNLIAPYAENLTGTIFIDGSDSKIVHKYVQALNQNTLAIDLIIGGWAYSSAPIEGQYMKNDVIHSRKFLRSQRSCDVDQIRMMGDKIVELTPKEWSFGEA
ncbi:MAG: DUF3501 family protein [Pseudomonadota bacterium]